MFLAERRSTGGAIGMVRTRDGVSGPAREGWDSQRGGEPGSWSSEA